MKQSTEHDDSDPKCSICGRRATNPIFNYLSVAGIPSKNSTQVWLCEEHANSGNVKIVGVINRIKSNMLRYIRDGNQLPAIKLLFRVPKGDIIAGSDINIVKGNHFMLNLHLDPDNEGELLVDIALPYAEDNIPAWEADLTRFCQLINGDLISWWFVRG